MAKNFLGVLLSDDDLGDERIAYWPPGETGKLGDDRFAYMKVIDAFLGTSADLPSYDPDYGFRMGPHTDLNHAHTLIAALEPLKHRVPGATGYQVLVRLFLAAMSDHQHPQALDQIHRGLREFFLYPEEVWCVVDVLSTVHADPGVWPRMASLIYDYAQWLAKKIGKVPSEIGTVYIPEEITVLEKH
jgi:hypothetical protein